MLKQYQNIWGKEAILMNRIEKRFNKLKKENKKAFITYMMAGLPDMEKCGEIIKAQDETGIDVIELGIPFSDPIADESVIQEASYKSIKKGTNLKKIFELMNEVRKDCEVPIVFKIYYNTILYYGIDKFINKCVQCGVDGIIIPDLPYEETFEIREAIDKVKYAPYLIPIVSLASKNRVSMIGEGARGFVYCMSSIRAIGQGTDDFYHVMREYISHTKEYFKIPAIIGFEIKTVKDIEPFKDIIDGCVVGSYLIKLMEESNYDIGVLKNYIINMKKNLNK